MPEERRGTPRARLAETRVIYQGASGGRVTARGLDVGAGGIFVQADQVLLVGQRLSIEIHVAGELAPWSAVGRVRWVREGGSADHRPAGMGVAFIDVDEAVLAAIGRLVARQPATSGATRSSRPPGREKTVLGVGAPAQAVPVAPIVAAAPAREKTVLGVAPAARPVAAAPAPVAPVDLPPPREPLPTRPAEFELTDLLPLLPGPGPEAPEAAAPVERSIAVDLVAKDRTEAPASARPPAAREESLAPAGVPKRRGAGFYLFLVLAAVAAAGYAQHARLRPFVAPYIDRVMALASPESATPPASPPPPASSATPPIPSAAPTTASTLAIPARSDAGVDAGRAAAPPPARPAITAPAPPPRRPPAPKHAAEPTEPPSADNPY